MHVQGRLSSHRYVSKNKQVHIHIHTPHYTTLHYTSLHNRPQQTTTQHSTAQHSTAQHKAHAQTTEHAFACKHIRTHTFAAHPTAHVRNNTFLAQTPSPQVFSGHAAAPSCAIVYSQDSLKFGAQCVLARAHVHTTPVTLATYSRYQFLQVPTPTDRLPRKRNMRMTSILQLVLQFVPGMLEELVRVERSWSAL